MPRIYKNYADYDSTQGQFTFQTIGSNHYLLIGAISARDQRLLNVVSINDYAGFEQNSERAGSTRILARWDATTGFQVEERLVLNIDEAYDILYTEDRPPEPDEIIFLSEFGDEGEPTTPFTFRWRDTDLTQQILEEAQAEITQIVDWEQGNPLIANFQKADIRVRFYPSATSTTLIMPTDPEWYIGIDDADSDPQPLNTVVRLGTFVDNGDNTGTIEVIFNTRMLDIMMQNDIHFELSVEQPSE